MNEQPWMTTLRDDLRARLAKCEPADRATFLRWYPEGIDNLEEPVLKNAIALVQRTLDADARRAAQEGKASRPATVRHGETCEKAAHSSTGYLHDENDDTTYDVDGLLYCGRCHRSIDAPEGKATP